MEIIIKTPLGLEKIVASRVKELEPNAVLTVKPHGYEGLVIVEKCPDKQLLKSRIEYEIPEAEKIIPVEATVEASLDTIAKASAEIARSKILSNETFAVRTIRRGKHGFTSVDVNRIAGAEVVKATGAPVNLDFPDKIVQVEIIQDKAALSILDGRVEWRKMGMNKRSSLSLFNRISIVQMPYLGSLEGARELGARIGRAVQAYEVKELVIAPNKPVNAIELATFINGVREGIESRYAIQRRSYARKVEKTPVIVQDLYQLVRERREEPIVVFEPEGEALEQALERLSNLFKQQRRVNFLLGSREGIPKGVYRIAHLVIDLSPDITLPTELAAPVALASVYTALALKNNVEE